MKDILGMVSLTTAASVLLILSAIWLIILIIKKENEYIFRAMMIMLLLLLGLIFLRQHEAGKWTWSDITAKIFPEKTPEYHFSVATVYIGDKQKTQYIFTEPKPKITLALDKSGEFFHVSNVKPVNDILKALDLPPVKEGVPELASITGSRSDGNLYRWRDYPKGVLTIERTLCQNKKTLQVYQCVENISILHR